MVALQQGDTPQKLSISHPTAEIPLPKISWTFLVRHLREQQSIRRKDLAAAGLRALTMGASSGDDEDLTDVQIKQLLKNAEDRLTRLAPMYNTAKGASVVETVSESSLLRYDCARPPHLATLLCRRLILAQAAETQDLQNRTTVRHFEWCYRSRGSLSIAGQSTTATIGEAAESRRSGHSQMQDQ